MVTSPDRFSCNGYRRRCNETLLGFLLKVRIPCDEENADKGGIFIVIAVMGTIREGCQQENFVDPG